MHILLINREEAVMTIERTCSRCSATFTPAPYKVRKCINRCNPCIAEYAREYRAAKVAAGLSYKGPAARNRTPHVTTDREREWRRTYENSRNRSHPDRMHKQAIRRQTRAAVSRGTLVRQPCEVCGADRVDAHHDDYSRPMNVRWLCPTHHRQHHAGDRA